MNTYRVMDDQYIDPNRWTGSPTTDHSPCETLNQLVGTAGPLGAAGAGAGVAGAGAAGKAAPGAGDDAGAGASSSDLPTPVVPRFINARVSDNTMNTVARM